MDDSEKTINQIVKSVIYGIEKADHTLVSGKAGILIALSYYRRFHLTAYLQEKVEDAIDACIDGTLLALEQNPMEGSLFTGLTGINYSYRVCVDLETSKSIESSWIHELEKMSLDYFYKSIKINDFDLMRGSLGIIKYFLDFYQYHSCFEIFINYLKDTSIKTEGKGVTWHTYDFNEKEQKLEYSKEKYNLGLAHGIPGIISILSEFYKRGICKEECYELIKGSINFITSKKIENADYLFPGRCSIDKKIIEPCRLSWCYGDLSLGIVLYKAGVYCKQKNWKELGMQICSFTKKRNFSNAFLDEHGFCHGFLGTMFLYDKLHNISFDKDFNDLANYWMNVSLDNLDFTVNDTGFYQMDFDKDKKLVKKCNPGLLQGLAGILLCLLTKNFGMKYPWDRIFLTNIEL